MPDDDRYTLTELADLAGVTPRTVRYYLAQGVLPAVGQPGPGAKYGVAHLARLRLVRRLQAEHLPLAEIRRRLDTLDDETIRELADGDPPAPPPESALDYLRTVLGGPSSAGARPSVSTAPPRRAVGMLAVPAAAPHVVAGSRAFWPRGGPDPEALASAPIPVSAALAVTSVPADPAPGRSQWERIVLAPEIELHLRRPLTRSRNKTVERLVAIARELLEEDPS